MNRTLQPMEGQRMVLRISKTGAIYWDAPFTQEELRERQQSVSCANPSGKAIALARFAPGCHGFVAAPGDVQVDWCIKHDGGWYIEDMDYETLAGPYRTLAAATAAGQQVFAQEAGASKPG
jgi:hypothetical protein